MQPDFKIRVLAVDDETALLDITREYLEGENDLAVTCAPTANEGLRLLATSSFDVVVSDYQMPVIDGIELLKKIRRQGSNVPFILFTGRGREEVVIEALNNGADFYLQKGSDPVSMYAELGHMIRAAVRERKVQEGLKLSETKFKKVFDDSYVALTLTDEEGRIIEWNRRATHLTGIPYDEAIGRFIWDVQYDLLLPEKQTPERYEDFRTRFTHSLRTGIAPMRSEKPYEGKIRNRNGIEVFFSQQVFTIPTSKGHMLYTVSWETTKYRQAEEEAHRNEIKYRTLLDEIDDLILVVQLDDHDGHDGRLIEMNEQARRRLGYDPTEFENVALLDLVEFKDLEEMNRMLDRLRIEGSVGFEIVLRCRDGATFPADVNARQVSLEGKNVVLAIIRDVTQRIKDEEDMRRALADLQESEHRFRTLSENAFEGIMFHEKGRIIDANQRFLEMFGYADISELIGRNGLDLLIAPESLEALRASTPDDRAMEVLCVRKDGSRFIGETLSRIVKERGHEMEFVCMRDVTERKGIEDALHENEQFLSSVFRSAPAGIGIVVDRHIKWVNQAMEDMVGYSLSELVGRSTRVLYPNDEEYERVGQVKYGQLRRTGKGDITTQFKTKDDRIIDVLLSSSVIHEMDISRGVTFTALDITERRRAEDALRQSEEKFRGMFENANDPMFLYYPHERYLNVNRAACRRYGYTKEEFLRMRPEDLDAQEEAEPAAKRVKMIDARGSFTYESIQLTKDGRKAFSEISARYVAIACRPAILAIARDISDRKSIEEGLKRANGKLNLLSSITRHDIRNQLLIGKGHLELLNRSCADGRSKNSLDKLGAALNNIERQIDFTKNYQDLGTAPPGWQSIAKIVAYVKGVQPIEDLRLSDAISGLEIFADPMVEKVFYNLFEDTLRYGGKPPAARIDASMDNDDLVLTYEDVGPGVPDKEKELIFQRGFGKGTGLGLFLSREILALTGITIKEAGIPGKGARFEIRVPREKHRVVREEMTDRPAVC